MPLDPASPLAQLIGAPMRPGTVEWIGLRPVRRAPMNPVMEAVVTPEEGLLGDHYTSRTTGTRQVTLIEAEDLAAIASFLGQAPLVPEQLRRNIVVRGLNLLALKGRRFSIGTAELEYTGECHPCSRMEETLGQGGYNAVRGHGGITARVVTGGKLTLSHPVRRID